jgi:hypothetical protein
MACIVSGFVYNESIARFYGKRYCGKPKEVGFRKAESGFRKAESGFRKAESGFLKNENGFRKTKAAF